MAPLSRAEARRIGALSRRRGREDSGLFLAEGIRVVEELLASGLPLELAVVAPTLDETERGRALRSRLAERVELREVEARELRDLADTETSQGVLVVAGARETPLAELRVTGASVVLLLDGVQDPGNLGTLARSAAAFGCGALVVLPGTVDPWNPKAVRAAAGALFRLPVVRADVAAVAEWLARHGFLLAGADAGGTPIDRTTLPQRVALAVGNEGAGLSGSVRERCERRLAVPMRAGTESLNVAVAAGILLYDLTRERA
ncbi:MAG: RNA methyltransferase [Gemmatimonadota bacterium]